MRHIGTNPLHLYRSLLRECTYLFDSNARTFCHNYVVTSFKRHVKPQTGAKTSVKTAWLPSKDESRRLKRGRKFLHTLERANNGYILPLEKVLKLTYARKGKRKRQIMQQYLAREPDRDGMEDAHKAVDMSDRSWRPSRGFISLARSQVKVQAQLDRIKGVQLSPRIPETNKWGKPMPRRRVKNMHKRWYARNAGCLLPPLQESEWQEIYALSLGGPSKPKQAHKVRRPQGSVSILDPGTSPSHVESEHFAASLAYGVQKDFDPRLRNDNSQVEKVQRPHRLTPRFLKRRMARAVLRYTPLALARDNGTRIVFRWEEGVVNRKLPKVVNDSQMNSLFG